MFAHFRLVAPPEFSPSLLPKSAFTLHPRHHDYRSVLGGTRVSRVSVVKSIRPLDTPRCPHLAHVPEVLDVWPLQIKKFEHHWPTAAAVGTSGISKPPTLIGGQKPPVRHRNAQHPRRTPARTSAWQTSYATADLRPEWAPLFNVAAPPPLLIVYEPVFLVLRCHVFYVFMFFING